MNTTSITNITIKEICDGFIYNELEGKGFFWACPRQDPFKKNESRRGRAVRSRFPIKNRESSTAITHAVAPHKKT